jgi:hypothetical protein
MGIPAATAGIEQGNVLTAINGAPLIRLSDFAEIIPKMAPGTLVHLYTWRNGEAMPVALILGLGSCMGERISPGREVRSGPKGRAREVGGELREDRARRTALLGDGAWSNLAEIGESRLYLSEVRPILLSFGGVYLAFAAVLCSLRGGSAARRVFEGISGREDSRLPQRCPTCLRNSHTGKPQGIGSPAARAAMHADGRQRCS